MAGDFPKPSIARQGDFLTFSTTKEREDARVKLMENPDFYEIQSVLDFQKPASKQLFVPMTEDALAYLTAEPEERCVILQPEQMAEALHHYYASVFGLLDTRELATICELHRLNFKYIQLPLVRNLSYLGWEYGSYAISRVPIDRKKLGFEALLADFLIYKNASTTKSALAKLIRKIMLREIRSDVREFRWEVTKTLPRLHVLKGDQPENLDKYLASYPGVECLLDGFSVLPEEAIELYSNAVFFKRYVPRHFQEIRANFEARMRRCRVLSEADDDEILAYLATEIENPLSDFLFGTMDTSRVNLFLVGYLCDLYRNNDPKLRLYESL